MIQQAIEVDHGGRTIRGMTYRPGAAGRTPAVLLLHGFTGQRIETTFVFVQLARALAERGIAAVTFDFLNSGESDGSFDQMLVTEELADALRMTQWLTGQPFVDRSRLGLLGFSLGGLVSACCMARTDVYNALAMMAPTTVDNMCRHAGREKIEGQVTVGPFLLNPRFFDDVRTLNPVADIIEHPRPTLVVQGTADTAVPPEVSQAFVDALKRVNVPVEQKLISDAEHNFGKPAHRRQTIESIVDFFARELL